MYVMNLSFHLFSTVSGDIKPCLIYRKKKLSHLWSDRFIVCFRQR